MNWKTKYRIQNVISLMPDFMSEKMYYFLQRKFGDLRVVNPCERLSAGVFINDLIKTQHKNLEQKIFFELGTGRRLNLPISLWLLNAGKIFTVDLNNYIKKDIIQEDLNFIARNYEIINQIFVNTGYDRKKLAELISLSKSKWKINDLLNLCNIEYITYCDAKRLNFLSHSVDYYISYTVLEHIPFYEITEIMKESIKVINEEGLLIHFIDYRDHFWYSDSTISPINFLNYSSEKWNSLAGNKFMFMNRLRHDDYISLFEKLSLKVIDNKYSLDNSFVVDKKRLDKDFCNKSTDILQTLDSWFILQKK